jgi:hypothetical protein
MLRTYAGSCHCGAPTRYYDGLHERRSERAGETRHL